MKNLLILLFVISSLIANAQKTVYMQTPESAIEFADDYNWKPTNSQLVEAYNEEGVFEKTVYMVWPEIKEFINLACLIHDNSEDKTDYWNIWKRIYPGVITENQFKHTFYPECMFLMFIDGVIEQ